MVNQGKSEPWDAGDAGMWFSLVPPSSDDSIARRLARLGKVGEKMAVGSSDVFGEERSGVFYTVGWM